jgi:hypothetical protein
MSDKQLSSRQLKQRNVLLTEAEEEDDSGGTTGAGSLLPEGEYFDIFQDIRSKHKGRVDPAREYKPHSQRDNAQTSEFNDDNHPLASKAYFSGIDNREETPLPGESEDAEVKAALEYHKKLKLQKQLGLVNATTPTPRPY